MNIETKYRKERIVYIEYFNRVPHNVITAYKHGERWIPTNWDFFEDVGSGMQLSRHNSGCGGDVSVIECPQFVDATKWAIWHDKCVTLKKGENVKILKQPILLKRGGCASRNPFSVSVEVYDEIYCKVCDGYHSEYCNEHMYEDENDNYEMKYILDNSLVNE